MDFDTLVRAVLNGRDSTMRAEHVRQLAFTTACWLAEAGVPITLDGEPFEPGSMSLTKARRFMVERGLFADEEPDGDEAPVWTPPQHEARMTAARTRAGWHTGDLPSKVEAIVGAYLDPHGALVELHDRVESIREKVQG